MTDIQLRKVQWYARTINDIAKMSSDTNDPNIFVGMREAVINLSNSLEQLAIKLTLDK